jgi:hypothetical protein
MLTSLRHRRPWLVAAALLSLCVAGWQNAHHLHLPADAHPVADVHGGAMDTHEHRHEHSHPDEGAATCDLCLQFSRLPAPPPLSFPPLRHEFALRLTALPSPAASPFEPTPDAHRARGPPESHRAVA